jgi:hypothetical protein
VARSATVAAAGVGLLLTSCAKPAPVAMDTTTTLAARPCTPMSGPQYPNTQRTLTMSGKGGTWCLHVGERVAVQLTAPAGSPDDIWSPVATSDPTRLKPNAGDPITPPRGETTTFLQARVPGEVILRATRKHGQIWTAGVVIQK